jgi:glycosyltransferase involved in cell wall biosynthesis
MNTKKRICLVSREYPPETHWGGIGTFTYHLARGLYNIGCQVDVICFTFGPESCVDDNGVTLHRIQSPKVPFTHKTWWDLTKYALFPFSLFYSYKVMKKIEELSANRPYDVIDFPEHIGEGFCSILMKKWTTLVRLYTPLSLIGELGLRRSTNILDYLLIRFIEKYSIANATLVTSPSQNLANLVADKFKIRKKIEIVYNPVDTDQFSPFIEEEKKDRSRVNILFVGRLEDRKGVHVLAQAIPEVLRESRDVYFTLLGRDCPGLEGISSMKDYIINILDQSGCRNNVHFADPVPYTGLSNQYRSADIVVVPSLYDNSPYTCLEALTCGVPVVGTSAGGMPEYIEDGKCGIIVPPNDSQSLTRALLKLAQDTQLRSAFGKAARLRALSVFKREVVAAEMVQLYDQARSQAS